jgi:acyl dehydratase
MTDLGSIKAGDELEPYVVDRIDPERMKTMAALYDDPNPIHFDLEATKALGMSDRLVLQGAADIAILLEPAIRLTGDPEAVRSYDVKLLGNLYAEDCVESTGKVLEVDPEAATVTVELVARAGDRDIAQGTAVVAF